MAQGTTVQSIRYGCLIFSLDYGVVTVQKTDETSFKVTHIPFDLYWTSGISDSTRIPL